MIDKNYRTTEGNINEDFDCIKKEILSIIKEQKADIFKIRRLFNEILKDVEDSTPITMICDSNRSTFINFNRLIELDIPEGYPMYTMPGYKITEDQKKNFISIEFV